MDQLKKAFPLSYKAKDVQALIITILIYLIIDIVIGALIWLLAKLPIVGFIFGIVGSLIGLYMLAGLVIAILVFLKVLE